MADTPKLPDLLDTLARVLGDIAAALRAQDAVRERRAAYYDAAECRHIYDGVSYNGPCLRCGKVSHTPETPANSIASYDAANAATFTGPGVQHLWDKIIRER